MMRDDVFFREIASNCWDAEERIEEYGKAGVQVQVVSTIPVMFSYWAKPNDAADLSRFLNDHIAQLVQDHQGITWVFAQSPCKILKWPFKCWKRPTRRVTVAFKLVQT